MRFAHTQNEPSMSPELDGSSTRPPPSIPDVTTALTGMYSIGAHGRRSIGARIFGEGEGDDERNFKKTENAY